MMGFAFVTSATPTLLVVVVGIISGVVVVDLTGTVVVVGF